MCLKYAARRYTFLFLSGSNMFDLKKKLEKVDELQLTTPFLFSLSPLFCLTPVSLDHFLFFFTSFPFSHLCLSPPSYFPPVPLFSLFVDFFVQMILQSSTFHPIISLILPQLFLCAGKQNAEEQILSEFLLFRYARFHRSRHTTRF